MKKIACYIYSFYVLLVLVPYFIFTALLSILLFKLLKWETAFDILRFQMRLIFVFLFIRVKVEYEEPLPKNKNFVFVTNHVSIFDVPLMAAFLPGYVNAIEAESHFKWPLYKHVIKAYQQIPINRNNVRESLKSFKIAEDRIKEKGRSIMVFPEGTRTKNGKIQPFKKLPFLMAQRAEAPIVPIGISGMWTLHPNNRLLFQPTVLKVKFGKVLTTEQLKKHNANELNEMAYQKVKHLIEYN